MSSFVFCRGSVSATTGRGRAVCAIEPRRRAAFEFCLDVGAAVAVAGCDGADPGARSVCRGDGAAGDACVVVPGPGMDGGVSVPSPAGVAGGAWTCALATVGWSELTGGAAARRPRPSNAATATTRAATTATVALAPGRELARNAGTTNEECAEDERSSQIGGGPRGSGTEPERAQGAGSAPA